MAKWWRIREGWGVLSLSLGLALVVSAGIASAGWTEGLNILPLASLGAFVIGLMIARSVLPGLIAHMFSLIIGFAWSFWLVARLFPDFWTWKFRWAWLWWYLYQWLLTLIRGGVSRNNLVFVLHMALITWLTTYLGMWLIFRKRQAWLAIVPGGALLLVNAIYSPRDITVYLIVYLALTLLLVIRFNLFNQEQIWRRERVHFNADEINFDFLRAGAIFTVVILALAWVTPTALAAQQIEILDALRGPWRDLQEEWTRLFASLNYRPTTGVDFYGRELSLGGPRELAEVPILEVKAPPNARYWRAVVFDQFKGRSWENTDNTLIPFGGDESSLPLLNYQARQVVTSTVTVVGPSLSMLPMAAQPRWVDQPTRANVSYVSVPLDQTRDFADEVRTVQRVDTVSFARSPVPLDAGDSYVVTSLLSQAPATWLQRAGTGYPAWVADRYLQLPEGIPDRVKQLAEQITAPYDTPYDKASAIERFLRSEIAYNEKIEAPPPDRDPVDYILFDLKQGYCDYYATSMAVMLRSVGIPSRVVSGYAQGHYDPERDVYVVLLQDAHTWVEVFFPNYGWVEFEPTAAQPAIIRPAEPEGIDPSGQSLEMGNESSSDLDRMDRMEELLDEGVPADAQNIGAPFWSRLGSTKPGSWLFGSLVLVALAAFTVWTMRNRRTVQLSSVGAMYHSMVRLAGWAGARTDPSQTPYEHASALGEVIPAGERPARRISGLYARERYGHKPPNAQEQASANRDWRELRPRLVRQAIMRLILRRGRK
ncbi:MAG: transglutaminaseTgpA domain-containing protein [Anaerolineae bacterium]